MNTTPIEFIKTVITRFGPRRAGSEAEKNAQEYFAEQLGSICNSVEIEEFDDALRAKFASLKLFCIVFYISLALPIWSLKLALLVSAVNAVFFFFHFMVYKDWLDVLYKKLRSHTVIGTIEPAGEVKHTVILSGHMDSTPEFIWWYYFKDWGVRMMMVAGIAFVFLPVFYLVAFVISYDPWLSYIWYGFAIASVFTLSMFFIHGTRVVDGAQDNLSGVAVAFFAAQNLLKDGKSILKNTRLKVVSFGSEETGLKGSKAFERRHRTELLNNTGIINLDGILDINAMHIVNFELSLYARHDKYLVETMGKAFQQNGLEKKLGTIPIGATDASSFTRKGIPAVSVVGLAMDKLHPTYHTRHDVIEHLNNDTLTKMAKVIADAVVIIDTEKGGK